MVALFYKKNSCDSAVMLFSVYQLLVNSKLAVHTHFIVHKQQATVPGNVEINMKLFLEYQFDLVIYNIYQIRKY
jgi:hypothetical protein